jgi:hypothetical protein
LPGTPAKVIASTMGLAGFTVAILAGLTADNPTESILGRAVLSMLVCNVVGFLLGTIGAGAIRDAADVSAAEAAGTVPSAEPGEIPLAA